MKKSHLLIEHRVEGNAQQIFDGFTRELFEALSPSFPPATLLRYDGNRVGDLVIIKLGVGPIAQTWVSEITEHVRSESECYFVDEGRKLPFPLKYWRHKHVIRQATPSETVIVEDITFAARTSLLTSLMKPVISAQFDARGPAYRCFFARKAS